MFTDSGHVVCTTLKRTSTPGPVAVAVDSLEDHLLF